MAATIAETSDTRIVRWTETDVFGESIVKTIEFDGSITDAYIETLVDDYAAATNLALSKLSVADRFEITGVTDTATNSLYPLLATYLGLAMVAPNPINPSKPNRKLFKMRGVGSGFVKVPDGTVIDGVTPNKDAVGTTAADRLSRITGILEDYLVFRPSETDPIESGTFVFSGSTFTSENRIMDNDNLT